MPQKINSFNILRIILCFSVVALHCNIFSVSNPYVGTDASNPLIYRILVYNLFWACVPIFYVLSLFLYILKRKENKLYFKKRISQLLITYCFWMIIENLLVNNGNLNLADLSLWNIFSLLSSHNTIFYFFFNLCWLTCILEIFLRANINYHKHKIFIIVMLVISLLLMFFGQGILNSMGSNNFPLGLMLGFSNPLLFLPYIIISLIIYDIFSDNNHLNITLIITGILWVIAAIGDWVLRTNMDISSFNYESLGRPSLVFEAAFIICLCLKFRNVHVLKFGGKLASLTFGIYAVHPIILNYISINLNNLNVTCSGFIIFILVISLSTVLVYIMKKYSYLL